MNGKIDFTYEGYTITFDFDDYRIIFPSFIPIDVWETMQIVEEFKLLYKILTSKFDYINGITETAESDYISYCKEYRGKYGDKRV